MHEHQAALVKLLKEFDRICKALDIPYVLFAGTMLGAVRHQGFIPWDDDLDVMMMRDDYDRFLKQASTVLDKNTFYLQKEFSDHWPMFFSKLRLNGTTCLEKYHPKDTAGHFGVYIDIFPCDNAADSGLGRKIQFFASKIVIAKSLKKRGYITHSLPKKMFMSICNLLPLSPFLHIAKRGAVNSRYVHSFFGGAAGYKKNIYRRSCFSERIDVKFEDGSYPIVKEYDQLLTGIYGDYMTLPPVEERVCKEHAVLVDLNNPYELYREYHKKMEFDVLTESIR